MSKQNNRLVLKIIVFTGKLFLLFKKYSIIVLKEVILVNFKEVLNEYLKELNCSSKKLSNESGLSESVISRYRSGERTPVKNSEQLNKLTKALFNIAKDNDKNKYTFDKIDKEYLQYVDYIKCGQYLKELKVNDNYQYGIKLATSNQKIYKRGVDY